MRPAPAYAAARDARPRHPAAARRRPRPARRRRPRDRAARRRRRRSRPTSCSAPAAEVDAIVCVLTDRIDAGVLAAGAPRLRVVANVAVGYDNIDVADRDRARHRGVQHARRARRDHRRPRVLPDPRRGAAHVRRGGRPAPRSMDRLPHDRLPRRRRPRRARSASSGSGASARPSRVARAGFGMEVLHHTRHDTGIDRLGRRSRRPAPRRRHRHVARAAHDETPRPDRRAPARADEAAPRCS